MKTSMRKVVHLMCLLLVLTASVSFAKDAAPDSRPTTRAPHRPISLAANADKKEADKKEEEPKGEPVDVDKLPKVVVDAVKKDMPGARITKAAKLEDGNYFLDDVKVGKRTWDVTVSPKGKIVKKVEMKDSD